MTTNEIMTATDYAVKTHTAHLLSCRLQRRQSTICSDLRTRCGFLLVLPPIVRYNVYLQTAIMHFSLMSTI